MRAGEFAPSQSQKRNRRRNRDLVVTACKPWATDEPYQLLRAYLLSRHPDGGMAAMDEQDFADMVEQTPVDSYMIEYPQTTYHAGRREARSVGTECVSTSELRWSTDKLKKKTN